MNIPKPVTPKSIAAPVAKPTTTVSKTTTTKTTPIVADRIASAPKASTPTPKPSPAPAPKPVTTVAAKSSVPNAASKVTTAMQADKKATSTVVANKSASAAQNKPKYDLGDPKDPKYAPTSSTDGIGKGMQLAMDNLARTAMDFVLGENLGKAVRGTGDWKDVTAADAGLAVVGLLPGVGVAGKGLSAAAKAGKATNFFGDVATTAKGAPKYAAAPKVQPKPVAPKPDTKPAPSPFGPGTPKPKEVPPTNPYGNPATQPKPQTPVAPGRQTPGRTTETAPTPARPSEAPGKTGSRPTRPSAPGAPRPRRVAGQPRTGPKTTPGTSKPTDTKPGTQGAPGTKPGDKTSPKSGQSPQTSNPAQFGPQVGLGLGLGLGTVMLPGVANAPKTGTKTDVKGDSVKKDPTKTQTQTNRPTGNQPKLPGLSLGSNWLGPVESNWQNYRR